LIRAVGLGAGFRNSLDRFRVTVDRLRLRLRLRVGVGWGRVGVGWSQVSIHRSRVRLCGLGVPLG